MLKVWGRRNSINVQKVMWAVGELSLAHEHIDAGGPFGGLDTDEFAALNPNRRVPVIDDDGTVVWESNAIVRYISAKHGYGTLYPAFVQARADAERWMDWCTSTLAASMTPLFWQLVRTPEDKRDAVLVEEARTQCERLFRIADAALANRPWIAGSVFTMGDIPLGCFAWRWKALPLERPALAHLDAWQERLATRAAFRRNVMLPLS